MSELSAVVTPLRRWKPSIHLGTRLRETRIQWGQQQTPPVRIDQDEFATLIGVAPGTYKGWEKTGRCADAVDLAKRIGDLIYGFDKTWFLDIADEEPTLPTGGPVSAESGSPCTRSPQVNEALILDFRRPA